MFNKKSLLIFSVSPAGIKTCTEYFSIKFEILVPQAATTLDDNTDPFLFYTVYHLVTSSGKPIRYWPKKLLTYQNQ